MGPEHGRVEATVRGVVQGVGFRWHARQMARRLGLRGYVRNRLDRTVQVVAEGNERRLREFLSYLQTGPSSAVVERVEANWLPGSGEFSDFEVRF